VHRRLARTPPVLLPLLRRRGYRPPRGVTAGGDRGPDHRVRLNRRLSPGNLQRARHARWGRDRDRFLHAADRQRARLGSWRAIG
jgi:hypothetical protein